MQTKNEQSTFESGRRKRRVMLMALAALTLTTACGRMGGSETDTPAASVSERTICAELAQRLPSWSRDDTEQSRIEGARFIDTFHAICLS